MHFLFKVFAIDNVKLASFFPSYIVIFQRNTHSTHITRLCVVTVSDPQRPLLAVMKKGFYKTSQLTDKSQYDCEERSRGKGERCVELQHLEQLHDENKNLVLRIPQQHRDGDSLEIKAKMSPFDDIFEHPSKRSSKTGVSNSNPHCKITIGGTNQARGPRV